MTQHELKTIQPYYNDVKMGRKCFEVRKNDRYFSVGDIILLQEYDQEKRKLTGRQLPPFKIIYILHDSEFCKEGFVILGFEPAKEFLKD